MLLSEGIELHTNTDLDSSMQILIGVEFATSFILKSTKEYQGEI